MEKKTDNEKSTDKAEHGEFEKEWDPKRERVSFNSNFIDHYVVQLSFISGILAMLYLIHENETENLDKDISFAILAAKDSAKALRESL